MFPFLYILLCLTRNILSTTEQLNSYPGKNGQEIILCRKCGSDIAESFYIISKSSLGARKVDKQNLFGRQNVTIQTLVNPFGVSFEILTTEKARCESIGPRQQADSWFPGYTWRLCACPHCGQHLGWTFEHKDGKKESDDQKNTFHGLILSNILGENCGRACANSSVEIPPSYPYLSARIREQQCIGTYQAYQQAEVQIIVVYPLERLDRLVTGSSVISVKASHCAHQPTCPACLQIHSS